MHAHGSCGAAQFPVEGEERCIMRQGQGDVTCVVDGQLCRTRYCKDTCVIGVNEFKGKFREERAHVIGGALIKSASTLCVSYCGEDLIRPHRGRESPYEVASP